MYKIIDSKISEMNQKLDSKLTSTLNSLNQSSSKQLTDLHVLFSTWSKTTGSSYDEIKSITNDLRLTTKGSSSEQNEFHNEMKNIISQLNDDCMTINASYDIKFNVLAENIHKFHSENSLRYDSLFGQVENILQILLD